MDNFEENVREALRSPKNQGAMEAADVIGTMGSADCGDMLRLWIKFTEKDGQKVIDRASFQSFGCQTAVAVASMATEILKGKTIEQAQRLSLHDLAGSLGALPPMKIHCGQLVEGALKQALNQANPTKAEGDLVIKKAYGGDAVTQAVTLSQTIQAQASAAVKVVLMPQSGDEADSTR